MTLSRCLAGLAVLLVAAGAGAQQSDSSESRWWVGVIESGEAGVNDIMFVVSAHRASDGQAGPSRSWAVQLDIPPAPGIDGALCIRATDVQFSESREPGGSESLSFTDNSPPPKTYEFSWRGRMSPAAGLLTIAGTPVAAIRLTEVSRDVAGTATPQRPQNPIWPLPHDEVDVQIKGEGAESIELSGTLALPKGVERPPCVLLLSGSGPQDRDGTSDLHRPLAILAASLAAEGIASLRCDDRGIGGSTGSYGEATVADLASDVMLALRFLADDPRVDDARLATAGFDEGALAAAVAHNRAPGRILSIAMGMPALRGVQNEIERRRAAYACEGEDPQFADASISRLEHILSTLVSGPDVASVTDEVLNLMKQDVLAYGEALRGDGIRFSDDEAAAMAQSQFNGYSQPGVLARLKFDPSMHVKPTEGDQLFIYGEFDQEVPSSPNAAAVRALGAPNSSVVVLRGLNHRLQHCITGAEDEYSQIEETMAPKAIQTMVAWLKSHWTGAP